MCVAYPKNRGISFFSGVVIKIYWFLFGVAKTCTMFTYPPIIRLLTTASVQQAVLSAKRRRFKLGSRVNMCVCDVPQKKFLHFLVTNKNEFLLVDMSKRYVSKLIENPLF